MRKKAAQTGQSALEFDSLAEATASEPDSSRVSKRVTKPAPSTAADSGKDPGEARLRELASRLGIDRPLAFLDLETTGTSAERDRIIEISVITVAPGGSVTRFSSMVDPGIPIPADSSAVHGITAADVADAPRFEEIAQRLADDLGPCDFCGFNLRRFDLKMLAAEFARVKIPFDPDERRVVDAMSIFHQNEKRDLEAAVRFYCGRGHDGHRAEEDVLATIEVLHAQLARYESLPVDVAGLDEYCRGTKPDWLTKDGKIAWRDGAPRITFGKHSGRSLQELAKEEPGYLRWITGGNFPEDTKRIATDALLGNFPADPTSKR